ncbi:MAG TPA: sulfite exporter TauE/SafE family protein [Thermoleophilaceae bacterium]|nr:sulfite exporter TauE/SafE family protein [Thermoleophilaceae bacterium]
MALAAVAAFAGAAVQSATGFGFALVLSPALFAVMDPVEAVTALLVLGLALNLLVLFEGGRPEHVDWRALAPMLVAAVPGLALGAVALTELSKEVLQVAVGVAVIAAAGWQLLAPHPRLSPAATWVAGFASGALTTSISVSGPPLVLWLTARGVRPEEFRASLAASFLALNLAGGIVLLAVEGGGAFDGAAIAVLLALVLAGYALGALAFRRIDRHRFFKFVLILVALTGAASVVAGLA